MASKPKTPKTRKQVQDDFDNTSTQPAMSAKERETRAAAAAGLRASVAQITAEKASQELARAGITMQKSLSALSEELREKLTELETVNRAIEVEREELTRLHGVDAVQSHLDLLLAQHEEKKQALEDEIEKLKQSWLDEQRDHDKHEQEQELARQEARRRDEDNYTYETAKRRKAAEDTFTEEMRLKRLNEQIRSEQFEKTIKERELAMTARETEFTTLKAQVEKFPQELDAAVKKAEGILENVLKRNHKHELDLLQKDREREQQIATTEKASLTEQISRLTTLNEQLRTELVEARKENIETAKKALDAASGQQSLNELRGVMAQQGNNGGAQKART